MSLLITVQPLIPAAARPSPAAPGFVGSFPLERPPRAPPPPSPDRAPPAPPPLTDDVVSGGAHLVEVDVVAGKALRVHQRLVHPDALLL